MNTSGRTIYRDRGGLHAASPAKAFRTLGRKMAGALLALTVLVASLPVGLPLSSSSFANECNVTITERAGYKEIHILGFIPCSRPKSNVTEGSIFDLCDWADDIPILAMTLDQINSDPTLLPGYRLVLDNVKSGVSRTTIHVPVRVSVHVVLMVVDPRIATVLSAAATYVSPLPPSHSLPLPSTPSPSPSPSVMIHQYQRSPFTTAYLKHCKVMDQCTT